MPAVGVSRARPCIHFCVDICGTWPGASSVRISQSLRTKAASKSNIVQRRYMSIPPALPKTEFLIKVPDLPNTSDARAKAKQAHADQVQPLVDSGQLTLGSVLMTHHPKAGERASIIGSILIMTAENEAEVRRFLTNDAYTREGVWDVKNAQIWPIQTEIRTAL